MTPHAHSNPQRLPGRSIPGTEPPQRALFVDRWGTLLEQPDDGRWHSFADTRFTPGAVDALFRVAQAGWRLYLIGNEDAVASGRVADATWTEFEAALLQHLHGRGVDIVRSYACLDHPQGKGNHRKNSVFRLPETGAFYHAAQRDGVQLGRCWVIGDSTLELVAGTRAGCRSIGVASGLGLSDRALDIEPDVRVPDLAAAAELFLASEAYARH